MGYLHVWAIIISMKLAKIHRKIEPVWHVQAAIVAAIVVQIFLSKEFIVGPRYALAIFEGLLLVAISLPASKRPHPSHVVLRRVLAIVLLAILTAGALAALHWWQKRAVFRPAKKESVFALQLNSASLYNGRTRNSRLERSDYTGFLQ